MRNNNPMHNPEYAEKNGKKHKRAVIIDNIEYEGVIDAAKFYGVRDVTITSWCKKGINPKGIICYYKDSGPVEDALISPKGKPVILDDSLYFNTLTEAAKYCGSNNPTSLCRALKQGRDYKGHKCRYASCSSGGC